MTRKNKLPYYFIPIILVCFLVNSCGFRLRGSQEGLNAPLPAIYIHGDDISDFQNILKARLIQSKTLVVQDKSLAELVLNIRMIEHDRRVLSVNTAGKIEEYELHYAVRFDVTDREDVTLLDDQYISATRDFSFDETDIIAKENEEERIFSTMLQDVATRLIYRLQVLGK